MYDWIGNIVGRLLKGGILLLWIISLLGLAIAAASNSVSEDILAFIGSDPSSYFEDDIVDPNEELKQYLDIKYGINPPPIESVIEKFLSEPSWTERLLTPQFVSENDDEKKAQENHWREERYHRLFEKVNEKLTALALEKNNLLMDDIGIYDIIPPDFIHEKEKGVSYKLPAVAVNWINAEKPRIEDMQYRRKLIDTFVLLMVLGAFGSLIFLTRDYILSTEDSSVSTYIFRPILGMFLAVAMLIVDISAHAILSQSDILEVRRETLYLLAFAAGLLSEQAYNIVAKKAKGVLDAKSVEAGDKPTSEKDATDKEVGAT
jgi:hypothetical protein